MSIHSVSLSISEGHDYIQINFDAKYMKSYETTVWLSSAKKYS